MPKKADQRKLKAWLKKRGVQTNAGGKILCELVECELGIEMGYLAVPQRIRHLSARIER